MRRGAANVAASTLLNARIARPMIAGPEGGPFDGIISSCFDCTNLRADAACRRRRDENHLADIDLLTRGFWCRSEPSWTMR